MTALAARPWRRIAWRQGTKGALAARLWSGGWAKDPAEVAASIDQQLGAQRTGWMAENHIGMGTGVVHRARAFVYQLGEQTTDEHDQPVYRASLQLSAPSA